MNLNKTFCSGRRCARRRQCNLWDGNLKTYLEAHPEVKLKILNIAQYADHDGACTQFVPLVKEEHMTDKEGGGMLTKEQIRILELTQMLAVAYGALQGVDLCPTEFNRSGLKDVIEQIKPVLERKDTF